MVPGPDGWTNGEGLRRFYAFYCQKPGNPKTARGL